MNGERRHIWILLAVSLLLFFVGNENLPVTDPVESNYAETAKEMLAAGEYVSPMIYGNYWYDKPILFYLELIAAFKMFGVNDFAVRFFPAVFASAGLFVTYYFGRSLYGAGVGFIAALLLGTSVGYWYVGHAVITDMTLFVAVSAALACFYTGWSRKCARYYYAAFFFAAAAVLTKGPIGLLLPGLIILLFLGVQRSLRTLCSRHMLLGGLLFAAVAGLWYIPMYLLHGTAFVETFFGVHNVLRATVSEHPKDNVWYFYLLVLAASFFPWYIPAMPDACRSILRRRIRLPQAPETRFLLIWAVTVFVCFQCFATKYVTYMMPCMMPAVILMARYFQQHRTMLRAGVFSMAIFYLVLVLFAAPPMMQERSGQATAHRLQEALGGLDDVPVLIYRRRYSASLGYYSGITVRRAENADNIEKIRPGGINWNSTNVMPFQAIEEIPKDREVIVLTKPEYSDAMQQEIQGSWKKIDQFDDWVIFRKEMEGTERRG